MNLDLACDYYKERKENPELFGRRKVMKIAESDYSHSLSEPRIEKTKKTGFDVARELLRRANL